MSPDQTIEADIQAKGLTAPRVSLSDLTANVAHTEIVTFKNKSGQILRWAVLTTQNGFAVTGRPSCSASSENDDERIGAQIAIDNARSELWPLMGYALKQHLHDVKHALPPEPEGVAPPTFTESHKKAMENMKKAMLRGVGLAVPEDMSQEVINSDMNALGRVCAPHQMRVIAEFSEVATRLLALLKFLGTPLFLSLSDAERERMYRQYNAMVEYQSVLEERIREFIPAQGGAA